MKISMIPNKIVKLIHAGKGDTSLRKWAFEPYDNNGAINVSNIKDQLVYKTENGGTEQLLPVNTSTPTTSYFDGTINYGTDTDVEFTYKQSSYTGQARVKSIKGNTLVWNQGIPNGNFADNTKWSSLSNVTKTVSNNVCTLTATADNITIGVYNNNGNWIKDHKYFTTYTIKGSNTSLQYNASMQYNSVTVNPAGGGTISSSWVTVSRIIVAIQNSTGFRVATLGSNGVTNDTVDVKDVMVIDLTTMFGSGNEPTLEKFKSLFPLPYYAYGRYLLNFNGTGIKTTGKNLFDKASVTANKTFNADGEVVNGSHYVSDYIPVFPNTDYYFSNVVSASQGRSGFFYDGNKNMISVVLFNSASANSWKVTTTSGTGYIRLATDTIDTCQLEIGSSPSTYEPYTSSTLSLPISTYFPTGMKSAGTIYDELSDKAITRIRSIVADGSQAYVYSASDSGNWATINLGDKLGKVANANIQLKCSNTFTPISFNDRTSQSTIFRAYINDSGHLVLRLPAGDTTFTSSAEAKTYFTSNPVTINYELATYTETDIQNASLVCKNIEVPCYLSNGNLVCDATEELTNESGFFDAKLKIKDSSSVAYSSKFKLHVEDL